MGQVVGSGSPTPLISECTLKLGGCQASLIFLEFKQDEQSAGNLASDH